MESNECYICTEQTYEVSPCQCKIPVHSECLQTWTEKSDSVSCSICKTPLMGYERVIESPPPPLRRKRCSIRCLNVLLWIICGIIGKMSLALMFDVRYLIMPGFWNPFGISFFIIASSLYIIIVLSIKSFMYIRKECIQQDEQNHTVVDDDSDSDSDGDIV